MGKQITIIFVVLFNCTVASSQDYWIKTATPCDKELLLKTPGEWMKPGYGYHATVSQQQLQEIENRLKVIHQFAYSIYPLPMAFDAVWGYSSLNPYHLYYQDFPIEKLQAMIDK
jgi:hypothetical protein